MHAGINRKGMFGVSMYCEYDLPRTCAWNDVCATFRDVSAEHGCRRTKEHSVRTSNPIATRSSMTVRPMFCISSCEILASQMLYGSRGGVLNQGAGAHCRQQHAQTSLRP